ncbi:MAG: DegT/DnrJ/EryC1/StrS aminotransferase family protein [Alphaproteobacteria bacterium]
MKHLVPDLPSADELLPWLRRIDAQRWYTNYGPLALELERELLGLAGGEGVALTTLATGYHALEFGLRVLDLPPGGHVLMPAVTFPACPLAAIHAGLMPVLADIDSASWILTPEIARNIAEKNAIAAVMPVAVYGVPVDAKAWDDFTHETGIPVLIDAAAALGAQEIPQYGLVAYSLHATKPFGIGEGGALAGRDAERIARARELSGFGCRERITHSFGSNGKLSEYHAAVGLAQIARWPGIKARRAALLEQYRAALAPLPVRFQPGIENAVVSLLMVEGEGIDAPRLMWDLPKRGIAVHQTYLPPLYRHPAFTRYAVASAHGEVSVADDVIDAKAALCRNAEYMTWHVIGLPFHPFMEPEDIAMVAEALAKPL